MNPIKFFSVALMVASSATVCGQFNKSASPSPQASKTASASMHGNTISGPFQLRYASEGSGPSVLAVGHATYTSRLLSRNLRQHLRLTFIDHRVDVASPAAVPATEFSLEHLIADIEQARQQLGLGRCVVFERSAHAPPYEEPELFDAELLRFLGTRS